jgi:hypothetical protein
VEIENRLPKKQEAHGAANTVGFISIRMEVIGQCRRHQSSTLPNNYTGVGKWLNPVPLQGAALQLRGFESRRRFHFNLTPITALTVTGAEPITAEAAMSADTFIIRLSAVNLNRRNHSDLPFLHSRM